MKAVSDKILKGGRPVILAGLIYTAILMIVVVSAWHTELHMFDLNITISAYVALRPWTAILYAAGIAVIDTLIYQYVKRTEMTKLRKVLYSIVFGCVLGCALFPSNRTWSNTVSNIHNVFAYSLLLMVSVSFIVSLVKAVSREQRILAILSVIYSALFLLFFVFVENEDFRDTVFVWENTFIYLMIIQLLTEKKESRAVEMVACYGPLISLMGMGICGMVYFLLPRNGRPIEELGWGFWKTMGYLVIVIFIFYAVFCISFILYLIRRPLPAKMKALSILLRIIVGGAIIVFLTICLAISVTVFAGIAL